MENFKNKEPAESSLKLECPALQNEAAANPHAKLYKYNGIMIDQAQRRHILLEEIKKRRNDVMDKKRHLDDILNEEEITADEIEPMEVTINKPRKKFFRLMLSEWLSEVPEDLENNWLIKLTPVGQRRLVVACKCRTVAYNKYGASKSIFQSTLPGGQRRSNGKTFTVLDCIYNFHNNTYYVLDIIAWNSYSLMKCSAEFRFFFLKSKLEESPELNEQTSMNEYKFVEVPFFPAELPLIEEKLSKSLEIENVPVRLDGLLFYYKEMFYHKGLTPFVGWLKPYMVPEVLKIPICEEYIAEKPKLYESFVIHLSKIQQHIIAKRSLKSGDKQSTEMECT